MAPALDWRALGDYWLGHPLLTYGAGPVLAVLFGFTAAATSLELLLASRALDGALVAYPQASSAGRRAALAATRERVPLAKQVAGCLWSVAGPLAVGNMFVCTFFCFLFRFPMPAPAWWPDTWAEAVLQLVAMSVVADFALYWGHRAQHEIPALWRIHKLHHTIDTPSPWSTLYIHRTDAVLQGSLPCAIAGIVVRPLPGVMYLGFALRVAENALNHTGLDHWLLNLVTLKSAPFRAPAKFHDAHHRFSNYAGHAKNYGESYWVWDHLFGTAGKTLGVAEGKASAPRSPVKAAAKAA